MNLDNMYPIANGITLGTKFDLDYGAVLASGMQEANNNLGRIANDVSGIRDDIWTNTLLISLSSTPTSAEHTLVYLPSSDLGREEQSLKIAEDLGKGIEKVGIVTRSAYSHGKEVIRLLKELEKLGLWFINDIKLIEFLETVQEQLNESDKEMDELIARMSVATNMLEDSGTELALNSLKYEIAPRLNELAKEFADSDLRYEIAVSILKGCIALKRVDLKFIELFDDTDEIRAQLKTGELKLPFKLATLEKYITQSREEIKAFRKLGQDYGKSQVLICGDPAEMQACRQDLDYQAGLILQIYADMLSKFNELKRLYEVYWIKHS